MKSGLPKSFGWLLYWILLFLSSDAIVLSILVFFERMRDITQLRFSGVKMSAMPHLIFVLIFFAIALASNGGTAFPICLNWLPLEP